MRLHLILPTALITTLSVGTLISAAAVPQPIADTDISEAHKLLPRTAYFRVWIQNCRSNFVIPSSGGQVPEYYYYVVAPDEASNTCGAGSVDGNPLPGTQFTSQQPWVHGWANFIYKPNNGNWWNIYFVTDQSKAVGTCVESHSASSYCLGAFDACTSVEMAHCSLF